MNLLLLNAAGEAVPAGSSEAVIVHDTATGLMWSADRIAPKELRLADAIKAAANCRLGGFEDWRVPTIRERLSIVDYDRFNPALNTDAFRPCEGWELTASPAAWSPRSGVWFVLSDNGFAGYDRRNLTAWLRVCRSVSAPASGQ